MCASLRKALEEKWRQFQNDHDKIENEASSDDMKMRYFTEDFFSTSEEIYLTQKGKLLDYLRVFVDRPPEVARVDPIPIVRQSLPKINIPKFSGDFTEWLNFRDLFKSMVIDAPLSPIERMHYLKTNLTKKASSLIASVPSTADNFEVAWQLLSSRYDKTRLLTNAQIASLFSLPAMTSESSSDLKVLYNGTSNALGALKALGRPVDNCDDFIVYMTVQKLDKQSRREWEASVGAKKEPSTFKELQSFLENRICSIEALEGATKPRESSASTKTAPSSAVRNSKKPSSSSPHQGVKSHVSSTSPTNQKCALCQEGHFVLFCEAFRAKTAEDRRSFVLENKLCLNCLGHHYARDCRSQKTCQACKGKHHTTLHDSYSSPATTVNSIGAKQPPERPTTSTSTQLATHNAEAPRAASTRVLLATALVDVSTSRDNKFLVRALIDQGSEATFISESLAQRMNVARSSTSVIITGIGANAATTSRGSVSLWLTSRVNSDFKCQVNALVLPKLTAYQPPSLILTSRWKHLDGLPLADPDYSSTRPIELLLGADVYAQLILDGVRKGNANTPVAQNTQLGWIISGQIAANSPNCLPLNSMQISLDNSLSLSLQRFWEQEEMAPPHPSLRPDEAECENHFINTHSREQDGRYTVRLPLKKPLDSLGDSYTPATKMLHRMEHRFSQDTKFFEAYSAFMTEYETLNHMEVISSTSSIPKTSYYLPHHGVRRESSTTTKLRVVFNGSQKTNAGHSLNDHLHVGPKILPELVSILLRWRAHAVVFSADMEKMYRQVLVHEEDRDLQRIFWRKDSSLEINTYRLRTVTYGLTCAPFLAIRVLRQLAHDERDRFPIGASALSSDVYVDDVLSGADDITSALIKQNELIELLKAGGFTLRKWTSNTPELLEHLTPEVRATTTSIVWQPETFHMLGLSWQSSSDSFLFQLNTTKLQHPLTKRNVLSHLPAISNFRIPRWLGLNSSQQTVELHGFGDASQLAYAAVVYLRIIRDGQSSVTLVSSKTKVAPVKQVSLPRLELCAANLVTRLAKTILAMLKLDCPAHLWSDSTITLAWIRAHPTKWTTYVANRVADIQLALPNAIWHHVESASNPADCASRGVLASDLQDHSLWWRGPEWLHEDANNWPSSPRKPPNDLPETRLTSHAVAEQIDEPYYLLTKYSNLTRLSRITAWCCRVNLTKNGKRNLTPALTPSEIAAALLRLIRVEQNRNFKTEIRLLESGQTPSKGQLLQLSPLLDDKGHLRVGGRLKNSLLDPDEKHPYILPSRSPLTKLLIEHYHKETLHGGVQLTLATLRQRYWVIGGRTAVKAVIHRCLICVRHRATTATQIMGNLPKARVTRARPFLHSGVDYAGPIYLRTAKGRGHKSYKAYIAVFVCFSTRAVHLEAVSDYTTDSFLAAFRRFVSRRGKCATLTSDCGTNFVGADAELRALLATTSAESEKIANILANDGTLWKFNPPAAPHFGGLWEAAVKSTKHHLRRVLGENTLTFEEMTTLLTQVEACLNSRPLQALTDDPDDLSALTPAHFLIGEPLTAVPEPSLVNLPHSRLSRFQLIQQMQRHFWNRWSSEYLHTLQSRHKWQQPQPSLQIGDLVLIKNKQLPPTKWPLARVTNVHSGEDKKVRVATVKTATSSLTRPVVKLCPLLKTSQQLRRKRWFDKYFNTMQKIPVNLQRTSWFSLRDIFIMLLAKIQKVHNKAKKFFVGTFLTRLELKMK
ncbi:uncharacterized protein LOC124411010 [Diprion similis]|uniref:uncharacterized protein LOC124411010 n=1 Tax=Diprion similis TaxID=362088 RepID=UPI001EF883B4|nr:uncharacterized protein LOC124411010 [Diprion similis]